MRLEYRNRTMLNNVETTPFTPAAVLLPHQRDQEAARAQTGASPSSRFQRRLSGAHKRLLTKLRVHHGLLVANMVEGHHMKVSPHS